MTRDEIEAWIQKEDDELLYTPDGEMPRMPTEGYAQYLEPEVDLSAVEFRRDVLSQLLDAYMARVASDEYRRLFESLAVECDSHPAPSR